MYPCLPAGRLLLVSCIFMPMLKKLYLENFRSHKKISIDLSPVTVFVGPNGAGKTNILEALGLLSFCRSFREENKKNLIQISAPYCRVICDDLELTMAREPRLIFKAKKNGTPKPPASFIGILPSVIISPETIALISGSPGDRRRFLDIMIGQEDREYLLAISSFKKIRYQRNSLLQRIGKGMANKSELDFWNREFIQTSNLISSKREEAIKFLDKITPPIYKKISGNEGDQISILYQKNYENLESTLKQNEGREIASGSCLFGAHRDDININLNNLPMANFASRGELKSAVLSLKMAELKFIEEHAKARSKIEEIYEPILLLDDIFSEFDIKRKAHLVELIKNYQTFITVTEEDVLPSNIFDDASIIKVKN